MQGETLSLPPSHDEAQAAVLNFASHNGYLDPDLIQIFSELHLLSTSIEDASGLPERISLSSRLSALEYQLLTLLSQPEDNSQLYICWLAAHVYIQFSLRELPNISSIHCRLVIRLRELLLKLGDVIASWEGSLKLLLWILFTCRLAHRYPPAQRWLNSLIWKLCDSLDLHSARDLEMLLNQFIWREKICSARCISLWTEMETQQQEYAE
jgi:hypothetical protein